jgi:AcrR family transcriptional regulator
LQRMTSDDRRAAIMETAIKLFSERGFRGTTTRALADAIGASEPVLYEHFKSKRELFEAIIDVKSREGVARATALLKPLADAGQDRDLLIGLGEFVVQCHTEDEAYGRLVLMAALEGPELGDIFYDRQRQAYEMLAEYFAARTQAGVFREIDPIIAARVFLGMSVNFGMSRMLYRGASELGGVREVVEQMVDVFLKGISK